MLVGVQQTSQLNHVEQLKTPDLLGLFRLLAFSKDVDPEKLFGCPSKSKQLGNIHLAPLQNPNHVVGVKVVKREDELFVVKRGVLDWMFGDGAADVNNLTQLAFFTRNRFHL
jgi:hypothetical protein